MSEQRKTMLPSIEKLLKEKAEIDKKILKIQERCPHPEKDLLKKPGSDTGNWDRGDDCWWCDFHCLRCGKQWTNFSRNF